jgi:hypothetical protein
MGLIGCAVCRDLLEEYREATATLVEASKKLAEVAVSREADAFMRLLHLLRGLNTNCADARKSFLSHFQSHSD